MNLRMLLAFSLLTTVLASSYGVSAYASTIQPATLADLTTRSARVFRGDCVTAEVGTAEIGGARIPVTRYTFRVNEYLKGKGPSTIVFRQVGKPEGGPRDLGRLAGLPVYNLGSEYVLFLLPESGAGLTSPAGESQGALLVIGNQVRGVMNVSTASDALAPARPNAQPGPSTLVTVSMPYEALRNAVLDHVSRSAGK